MLKSSLQRNFSVRVNKDKKHKILLLVVTVHRCTDETKHTRVALALGQGALRHTHASTTQQL